MRIRLGFFGDDTNLYRYVLNRPTVFTDSQGLWCDDLCDTEHELRNAVPDNLALKWWPSPVRPGVSEELTEAVKVLKTISTLKDILKKDVPALVYGLWISAASEHIMERAQALHGEAMRRDGVAIWVHVSWQCCECERCWLFWSRLNWQDREGWHKCKLGPPGGWGGFSLDDPEAIARAIRPCLREALQEEPSCP